jgi:hypothetical protein
MSRRYSLEQVSQILGQDPYVVYYLTAVGALPGPGSGTSTRRQEDDDGMYSEADLGMVKRAANGGLLDPPASGLSRRNNRAPEIPPDVEDPRVHGRLRLRLRTPGDEQ